jgi:hypothetical protein
MAVAHLLPFEGNAWRLPGRKEGAMIDFRWVAVIALWTMLSGPIFGPKGTWPSANSKGQVRKAAPQASRTQAPRIPH